jgi:hypothetical protein
MKLILAIIVCSALHGECSPPIQTSTLYDSWYECMNSGYLESRKVSQSFGYKKVNEEQIYVKFYCVEAKNTI